MNKVLWYDYYMYKQEVAGTWTQIYLNQNLLTDLNNPPVGYPDIKNKHTRQGRGEKGTFPCALLVGRQMMQPLRKTLSRVLKKTWK